MNSYSKFKKEILKNPTVKKEYEKLGPEFEIISLLIKKRINQGLSQRKLAEKIGTKQSSISRFESGTYNPTIDFLQKIASGLNSRLKISISAK